MAVAAYACVASPYAYTLVTYELGYCLHRVHGAWPGPDVLPHASEQPYYLLMVIWLVVGLVLFLIGLVLLMTLGVVWKRDIALPMVLWLVSAPLLAYNWISDFTTWLSD